MNYQLNLGKILKRAALYFGEKGIVYFNGLNREEINYQEFFRQVLSLVSFLKTLGVRRESRVGALAWNNLPHLLLYFAVPLAEAVLHPVNLRYSKEQILYTINHARDEILFTQREFLPLINELKEELHLVREVITIEEINFKANVLFVDFDEIAEDLPAKLCYTTATTGTPKGVLYTHRDLYLHSMALCMANGFGIAESDKILVMVPMYHVNSWGIPYAAAMAGATMVLPGNNFKGEFLAKIIAQEKVTLAAGVPTVFQEILKAANRENINLGSLRKVLVGGAPLTMEIIEGFSKYGVAVEQVYGLTETAPFVASNFLKSSLFNLSQEKKQKQRLKLGLPAPGIEVRVVGEKGEDVPRDGKTVGELWLKGPWLAREYYNDQIHTKEAFVDGWFRTYDLVTIDEYGYLEFCDREKDVIKSGGEWISTLIVEKYLLAHPDVKEVAVVGLPHPVWQERPVAFVILWEDARVTEGDLLNYLRGKLLSFWIPDRIVFLNELPQNSVGKVQKKVLRERFQRLLLDNSEEE
ncbi:long-chain-fatty-acid--CoA ligase [Carboxydothermus pertinax]|nr:long-chain-fatty-acid--CoA ligase [Carboxydothermus pertinax]